MIYLIPDTNTWIYLANGKDPANEGLQEGYHLTLLERLHELVAVGRVVTVINDIIETEWVRNREHTQAQIKSIKQRKQARLDTLNTLKKELGDGVHQEIEKLYKEINLKFDAEVAKNEQHIINVEGLLAASERFEASKDTKAAITNWAVKKKAPFIGDKSNSTADAVILFGAIEFIAGKKVNHFWGPDYPPSYFISGNIKDFAVTDRNNTICIHPDLQPLLNEVKMKYFRSLPAAIREIDQELLNEEELARMEEELEWLSNQNTASCLECDPNEKYINNVRFGEPFEISNQLPSGNPNQLELGLEFADPLPTKKQVVKIQQGWCDLCGAAHIMCECGEVISTESFGDGVVFACEACEIRYQMYYEYQGSGMVEEQIFLARENGEDQAME